MDDRDSSIPASIAPYLWDTPIDDLSYDKHYAFIIERVLEYGDMEALIWLNETFDIGKIKEVLCTSKRISARTGNFYARIYQVDHTDLTCLQKPYIQKQNRF